MGFSPEIRVKDIAEDFPAGLTKENIAIYLSKHKATAYVNELKDQDVLLTADTIVWCENELLGKPVNRTDAIRMLSKLQGRDHQVYTGVSILSKNSSVDFFDETTVWFKSLSESEISSYVDHYQPFDKAGAYGCQEFGAFLVREFKGSYTNVVGLPLGETLDLLSKFGAKSLQRKTTGRH